MAGNAPAIAAWLAWLDTQRTLTGWCIAYREDGRVCRAPATRLDRQRGGGVYAVHAPAPARDPETGEEA